MQHIEVLVTKIANKRQRRTQCRKQIHASRYSNGINTIASCPHLRYERTV